MVEAIMGRNSFVTLKNTQRHELFLSIIAQKNPATHSEAISQLTYFWGHHPNDIIRFVKSQSKKPNNCILDEAVLAMIDFHHPRLSYSKYRCTRLSLACVEGAPSSAVTWLQARKIHTRHYDEIYGVLTSVDVMKLTMPSDDEDDEASIEVSANETSSVNLSDSPVNTVEDPVEVSSCDESSIPSDQHGLTTAKKRRTSSSDDEDYPAQPQTKRSIINVTHAIPKMFHFENCPVTINILRGSQQSDDEESDAEEA